MATFTETKIVLMYKTKPTEQWSTDQDMFVDLDLGSGGYPTRTRASNAHDFKTVEKANQYNADNEFVLTELTATYVAKEL